MTIIIEHLEYKESRDTMLIRDIFAKPIDRNIEGVIKVGQAKEENVQQELEEYVVTKELQKHFKMIFEAYAESINQPTDKMGIWIQGFFGSGKSHFLKIISYLLANQEVNGEKAIDYFKEDQKIKDPSTLDTIEKCTQVNSDVILFNIDSKSDAGGKKDKSGIVNVFLKVFNEKLGLSTIPYLADFERYLIREKKYDDFKIAFKEITKMEWKEERHEFDWIQDDIKEAILKIDLMSDAAADNFLEKASGTYSISIESFAKLVKEHIDRQNGDYHIAFLVDEVGQYIGGNRDLTLQLQTVVEDLGRYCEGKAWVIVTSQEAIDHVSHFEGYSNHDFSKIKDRFATTVSLSSANADEVIKERILKKKKFASDSLEVEYESIETELTNKLLFVDSPELKLFESGNDYAEVYPFVPYQFNLLGQILTEIRQHSYEGSNLSSGERSLLAMFKEAAERNKENDTTSIVSLDQFYASMEKWLDTEISRVIVQATNNSNVITPMDTDEFNVDVLRVLFMIKYVDNAIKPNVENITSLMIRNVDEDRVATKKRVESALEILIEQNFVRKNLDSYIFQTNEEQEITQEIKHQEVSNTDLVVELSKRIFDGVLDSNSFAYDKKGMSGGTKFKNRYIFTYAPVLDQRPHKQVTNADMTVQIISPYSDLSGQDAELAIKSSRNLLLIELPNDSEFKTDLSTYIQMNRYLTTNYSSVVKNFERIRSEKSAESQELSSDLDEQLSVLLKNAKFFYNGEEIKISGADFKQKLQNALQKMADEVYHKLGQIDSPKDDGDILAALRDTDQQEMIEDTSNQLAIDEIFRFVTEQKQNHLTITMKTIRDRFETKQPYGFNELDVEWCIAILFITGKIDLLYNNVNLSRMDSPDKNRTIIQKRRESEKIKVEPSIVISNKLKKTVDQVARELLHHTAIVDDNNNEKTMQEFNKRVEQQLQELKEDFKDSNYTYPSAHEYETYKRYLEAIDNTKDIEEFFNTVKKYRDELFDWAEIYEQVQNFHKFGSKQKEFWEKAQDNVSLIESSQSEILNDDVRDIIAQIKTILKKANPYSDMSRLNELNEQFRNSYSKLLEEQADVILAKWEDERQAVLSLLANKPFEKQFMPKVNEAFQQLKEKIETADKVDTLVILDNQVKQQFEKFSSLFDNETNRRRQEEALRERQKKNKVAEDYEEIKNSSQTHDSIQAITPIHKTVSLRSLNVHSRSIDSIDDVDALTRELNQKLKEQLDENIILDFNF
ncbi:MAG: BREX system P-loop protein BrxC [Tetragenococcus koreensis]|nr:BREX system P-loop protein BrxC [Tetragenococcus koreensis]